MKLITKMLAIISIVLGAFVIINDSSNEINLIPYMILSGGLLNILYGIDHYREANKTTGVMLGLAGSFVLIVGIFLLI